MNTLELVEDIIRLTIEYSTGQINYKKRGDQMIVWSTIYDSKSFHATEMIPLFALWGTYIDWNEDEKRCELHIF